MLNNINQKITWQQQQQQQHKKATINNFDNVNCFQHVTVALHLEHRFNKNSNLFILFFCFRLYILF